MYDIIFSFVKVGWGAVSIYRVVDMQCHCESIKRNIFHIPSVRSTRAVQICMQVASKHFFTYMLRQNGKRFYKGLYVTLKLAPDIKKNTVYSSSYNPYNEGHVNILTNSMLRTYTSDIDERIILR